jgi:hypothetical protein
MRRTIAVGSLLAVVYVAASATTALMGRRVRPLFEGFSPPPAYQWVSPPAQFASGNQKPSPTTDQITVTNGRSNLAAPGTGDGQFSMNLPPGAITAAGASSIRVHITPLDPATLGPLPAGLFPDGNAYHVELTLDPSSQPVTNLDTSGNLVLQLPAVGHTVLFSPDGKTWQDLQAKSAAAGSTTMVAAVKSVGFFVGAATADINGQTGSAAKKGSGSSTGTIVLAVLVVLLVIAILFGPLAYRRLRPRPGPSSGRRAPNRPTGSRPPAKGNKKKPKTKRRR